MQKPLNKGRVRSFNDKAGYGFIVMADGRIVFAHYTQITADPTAWRTLEYNEEVEFDLYEGEEGLVAHGICRKAY